MADTGTTTTCAVAELARNAQANTDAYNHADRASFDAGEKEKIVLTNKMDALSDALSGIEVRASHLVAASGVGAMFQLHLISGWVDCIHSWVPENCKQASDLDKRMKEIVRMLYSVQMFIEQITGESADDAVGEYYMSRRFNPHQLIETALASEWREAA